MVSTKEHARLLTTIQPMLLGWTDGAISTLAPVFAAAYVAGSRAALLVGVAAAIGAAVSMAWSEALSDDGELTGRGSSVARGTVTGLATFLGAIVHVLPFIINETQHALAVAYVVVMGELLAIAWVRKRYMTVGYTRSLAQLTAGVVVVVGVGILVGHS